MANKDGKEEQETTMMTTKEEEADRGGAGHEEGAEVAAHGEEEHQQPSQPSAVAEETSAVDHMELPPDLQLHGANGELAAKSAVITAVFEAPSIIVVGGGAPQCPCVYVDDLHAQIEGDNDEPPLELGDEITMVGEQVTIGKTRDEVQQMLCSNSGEPVSVTYRKLPDTLADAASKGKFHFKMLWSKLKQGMVAKLSPQLRATFRMELASMHSFEIESYAAKVESVDRSTEFYQGLTARARVFGNKMTALASAAEALGNGLQETLQGEQHGALKRKTEVMASTLLSDADACRRAVEMIRYVCEHLQTFVDSVLADVRTALQQYKECQDDFLAVSLRVFEMYKQQEDAMHRGQSLPDMHAGNYVYRHVLREKGRLSARHARLRQQTEGKMRLLVVENARDMATQLSRMVMGLADFHSAMAPVMAEAAQTIESIGDNSNSLFRAANIDTLLEPLHLDTSAEGGDQHDGVGDGSDGGGRGEQQQAEGRDAGVGKDEEKPAAMFAVDDDNGDGHEATST